VFYHRTMRIVLLLFCVFLVGLDCTQDTRGKKPKYCKKPKGKIGSIFFKSCYRYECIKKKKKAVWHKSVAEDKCCFFDSVAFPVGSTMLSNETTDSCTSAAVKCVDVGGRLRPAINIQNVCPMCTTTSPTTSAINGEEPVEKSTTTTTTKEPEKETAGWRIFQSFYYKQFEESSNWPEARERCIQEGGDLASVLTLEESDFITTSFYDLSGKDIWIGGYSQDKSWKWSDGSLYGFRNWAYWGYSYSPSDGKCVFLSSSSAGQWNGIECSQTFPAFICKKNSAVFENGQCAIENSLGWKWIKGVTTFNPGPATSLSRCRYHCAVNTFNFTAVFYRWCHCGNVTPRQSAWLPSNQCGGTYNKNYRVYYTVP